jgi:hypothetical protein
VNSRRIKKALLGIITNPESDPKKVYSAFVYLYRCAEERVGSGFGEVVEALYKHHPMIAKGYLAILPERFIPKGRSSVDGYVP